MSGLSACPSLGCSLNIYVPKSCLSLLLLSADTARLVCCFPLTMTDCLVFVWSLFPHRLGSDADSSWTHLIGRHWKLQPCFLIVYSQQRKTCMQRSPITSKAVSEIPNQGTSHHCNYPTCKTPPWQSMEACDSEEHSVWLWSAVSIGIKDKNPVFLQPVLHISALASSPLLLLRQGSLLTRQELIWQPRLRRKLGRHEPVVLPRWGIKKQILPCSPLSPYKKKEKRTRDTALHHGCLLFPGYWRFHYFLTFLIFSNFFSFIIRSCQKCSDVLKRLFHFPPSPKPFWEGLKTAQWQLESPSMRIPAVPHPCLGNPPFLLPAGEAEASKADIPLNTVKFPVLYILDNSTSKAF